MYAGLWSLLVNNWIEPETVQRSLWPGADDETVLNHAKDNGMILVTGDCQIPRKAKEIGAKVVLVTKEDLASLVETKLRALNVYLNYTKGE